VLKYQRGVSFEELLSSELIEARENPKRPNQWHWFFWHENYVWVIACVVGEDIFLKTLYPSRKHTKQYLKGEL
jgi:hypothetical protein